MSSKIKLKIAGMHCTSCAMNIDGELEDTAGVKEAKTNYAKQCAEVTFDQNEISEGKIISIIQKLDDKYVAEVIK
ncbi:MAG TPA: heavy-metal-associated domain-containing protein [Candidatus Limnocylindrales bacterium]|nr:heavy-metal-associated domain-containing protein [Candidatus Limnocylindrales bacterium]